MGTHEENRQLSPIGWQGRDIPPGTTQAPRCAGLTAILHADAGIGAPRRAPPSQTQAAWVPQPEWIIRHEGPALLKIAQKETQTETQRENFFS